MELPFEYVDSDENEDARNDDEADEGSLSVEEDITVETMAL